MTSSEGSATASIYAAAQLGGRFHWGETPAVVVVDLSNGFTDPGYKLGSDLSEVVSATSRLLEVARSSGVPVAFTTVSLTDDDIARTVWLQKLPALAELKAGTESVAIDARLKRKTHEPVITKRAASGTFGTDLMDTLRRWKADTVVLCGATTSGCVRATAVDLVQFGLPVVIPEECVGDRAPEPHRASLVDLQAKYADVVHLEDAVSYLQAKRDPASTRSVGRTNRKRREQR